MAERLEDVGLHCGDGPFVRGRRRVGMFPGATRPDPPGVPGRLSRIDQSPLLGDQSVAPFGGGEGPGPRPIRLRPRCVIARAAAPSSVSERTGTSNSASTPSPGAERVESALRRDLLQLTPPHHCDRRWPGSHQNIDRRVAGRSPHQGANVIDARSGRPGGRAGRGGRIVHGCRTRPRSTRKAPPSGRRGVVGQVARFPRRTWETRHHRPSPDTTRPVSRIGHIHQAVAFQEPAPNPASGRNGYRTSHPGTGGTPAHRYPHADRRAAGLRRTDPMSQAPPPKPPSRTVPPT